MSITIADCLNLPALREARVLAGHKGLNRAVSAVSVLEYAHISALAGELFLGNELILTAFTSVKDSVEKQCAAIRRLHEVGEIGIVIYYVGYFVLNIDAQLIKVANELDFPLIIMPPNTYSQRYSDVITEVLREIFEDQKKEKRFVTRILDCVAQMQERKRTPDSVLRLLSDRLRCSLLLLNRNGEEQGAASWPVSMGSDLAMIFQQNLNEKAELPNTLYWKGRNLKLYRRIFNTDFMKSLQLYVADESGILDAEDLDQAIEVIQMFYSIWRNYIQKQDADILVRAILNDQPATMYRIAGNLHIDLKKIRVMWVLKNGKDDCDNEEKQSLQSIMKVKSFLKENGKIVLTDTFDDGIVAFMDEAIYAELDMELANQFMTSYQKEHKGARLLWCGSMDSTQDVRKAYMLMEATFTTACNIYPHQNILTSRELKFAQQCSLILSQGESNAEQYLEELLPLRGQKDEEDLLNTLTVYLLDANKSMVETSVLLYVHESTIKYRINKIQRRIGYDITQLPGEYRLYLALALRRLSCETME